MRIVSITEGLYMGGDEQRLLRFCRAIKGTEHTQTVIVLGSRRREGAALDDAYAEAGINLIYMGWPDRGFGPNGQRDLNIIRRPMEGAQRIGLLAAVLRQERADILDLRKHYPIVLGSIAGRIARVPAIVGIDYHPGLVERGVRRKLANMASRLLDGFVSDVHVTVSRYEMNLPALAGKAVVIHNGVPDPSTFASRSAALAHFGYDDNFTGPTIAQVATLVPFKGQHLLLDAIGEMAANGLDARFILCGYTRSPDYVAALQAKVATMGLCDRVRIGAYPGPTDDIWSGIDIHVHAATMDSAPAAIHESMAYGIPLVSTDVGGIREIVVDGETAFLLEPGDASGIAAKTAMLVRDGTLRAHMGRAARRRHDAMFTIDAMTEKTLRFYRSLIEQPLNRTPIVGELGA